jgi:hypothetical protein
LWSVPTSGTYALTATTALPTDGDPSNNSTVITGLTPVAFTPSNDVLLSWQDATEQGAYSAALSGLSIGYDSWDRNSQGNLYGLESWSTVIFAEQAGLYPAAPEQYSLMRFLDEGSAMRAKKYLLLTGDHIANYYDNGTLMPTFYEDYLHATSDGDQVEPAGIDTMTGAPCSYIGGASATASLIVDHNKADEIGADAFAETLYVLQGSSPVLPVAIQYCGAEYEHVYLGFGFSDITTGSQRQSLLERILQWFDGPPPPAAMGEVTILATGSNIQLSWALDPTWVCPIFRIYRSTDPHFLPSTVYDETSTSPYLDIGAAGNPTVNYFYRVAPVDFSVEGNASDVVGEFDFDLP